MTFEGIPPAALDFYEDLEADNSKAFWQAHRETYETHVRVPVTALADALAKDFGDYKYFRPYRDVRFSKDKTPYKTHQGVWFGETSCYLHVSAAGLFLAAGYWHTTPAQVGRLRRGIDDDVAGPELARVVEQLRLRGHGVDGTTLTRVPSGFDRDHPRGDLLRHRTLTVSRELGSPAWLATRTARPRVARLWREFAPLVSWLDTHVGQD